MSGIWRAYSALLSAVAACGLAAMLVTPLSAVSVVPLPQAAPDAPAPRILYVDDDAPPPPLGDGRNWRLAFRDLQDALAEAERPGSNVREIRVAQGVYKPDRGLWVEPLDQDASFWLIDGMKLRGGYRGRYAGPGNPHDRDIDAFPATLSGDLLDDHFSYDDNSFHIVTASYVGSETLLEGFEIREGTFDPKANPPEPTSGALICFAGAPRIEQCTFADNRGSNTSGSAVLLDSSAEFRKCLFWFNLSDSNSGAMVIVGGHPIIEDCEFTNNVAYYESAGALKASISAVAIRRCRFTNNVAGNQGGATYLGASQFAVIEDCIYLNNSAGWEGGGHWGNGTLVNCLFVNNHASTEGGGVRGSGNSVGCLFIGNTTSFNGGSAIKGGGTRINCIFLDNHATSFSGGGAVWAHLESTLINCVFSGNESLGAGAAIYCDASVPMQVLNCSIANNTAEGSEGQAVVGNVHLFNSVVWNNSGGSIGSSVHAAFSCIENGPTTLGNINADPQFVLPLGLDGVVGTPDDDLRLRRGSRCVDRGSNAYLPADALDLDGDGDVLEPLPFDALGLPRLLDDPNAPDRGEPHGLPAITDLGAFEFAPQTTSTSTSPRGLIPSTAAH